MDIYRELKIRCDLGFGHLLTRYLAVKTFFLVESVTSDLHPKHCTKRVRFQRMPSGTNPSTSSGTRR